ncbi:MAG: 50S ribosomal protein L20 [Candidatus Phytoplasma stylosanthis]|uniref:50S ribosomal protein L20 n=1 Tax=Candidatus Phytoplasma stylosanthis TaxID=2798314 RepID=UPI00293B6540|nr:50S ribosomal protein L20 [Candidatus Phytoplasma stylosanthis]MDV3168079.1 50S ribosomal protein L20 [Candidatus Phytoplasma stylosanthis]MDV3170683.1 50S ribosomal protein L20 [Candidatus Phytoplasma stylosanthis]MDV3173776.1 50S ribosomal protein L20 [Candidatus Phytoplasma stylosanthis]MDV3174346.1 50S ribosomal protein L20 [Candidatus Phytoplasma stylosanthis]MDV3202685.1 50S ribosomal protein L20 [Candidatus Phytoplasma stylosanthis]
MVKINFVTSRHKRRKKIMKLAKGYFGSKSNLYKTANEQVMRSLQYSYRDRKRRKRDFRKLWITRINAGCMNNNINYSQFMHGLSLSKIEINRKILSDISYNNPEMFLNYIELSRNSLEHKKALSNISDHKDINKTIDSELKKENLFSEEKNSIYENIENKLEKSLMPELKILAKKYEIPNISKLKKIDLINLLKEKINK